MIELHQFHPVWGLPNASPFCMKVETYLRMAKISYRVVYAADPRRGPKGKLPYIVDGDVKMGDSELIIDYLKKKYGNALDVVLSPADLAVACAFERLLSEHLYWIGVYFRWFDETNWEKVKSLFFGRLPFLLRPIIARAARKGMWAQLYGQGMGRHSREEIAYLGREDLRAVSAFLGDKAFLMGESPTTIDASLYAFLANLLRSPLASPLSEAAQLFPNLSHYCDRMKTAFYS